MNTDIIKFLKAQIDAEMAKLEAPTDDRYIQGQVLAYTNVTSMLLEACLLDFSEELSEKE